MASHKIKQVSDNDFDAEVLKSDKLTLVDFWATWCAPCRAIAPHVEDLAVKYDGKLKVAKVDVDHSPNTASQFHIRSIPTLLLFHQGKVVGQLVGAAQKAKLETFVENTLTKVGSAQA